jgi:hypothetical protein
VERIKMRGIKIFLPEAKKEILVVIEHHIHQELPYTKVIFHIGARALDGYAYLNPKDIFNREYGRKIACARALKNSGLSKRDRLEIWKKILPKRLCTSI